MVLLHIVIYVPLSSPSVDRQRSRQTASHTETRVDACGSVCEAGRGCVHGYIS